jgi:phage replication initiation protein
MTIDIPQAALDALSGMQLIKLLLAIKGCDGFRCRRLDVYYDDFCKIISPEAVDNLLQRGGVGVPRYEKVRPISQRNLQTGVSNGYTLYFGSPKSQKQVRFYDKAAESDGRRNCYRWEVQYDDEYAEAGLQHLLEALVHGFELGDVDDCVSCIANAMKSLIAGAISFHEIPLGTVPRELGTNWAARSPLTWWWKEILQGLEPAKLTLEQRRPSLEKQIDWIRSQVAPSLAVVKAVFEFWNVPFNSWLKQVLEDGAERWSKQHEVVIETAFQSSPAY